MLHGFLDLHEGIVTLQGPPSGPWSLGSIVINGGALDAGRAQNAWRALGSHQFQRFWAAICLDKCTRRDDAVSAATVIHHPSGSHCAPARPCGLEVQGGGGAHQILAIFKSGFCCSHAGIEQCVASSGWHSISTAEEPPRSTTRVLLLRQLVLGPASLTAVVTIALLLFKDRVG